MLSNYKQYEERAAKIRDGLRNFKTETEKDTSRTPEYKKAAITEARRKAEETMSALRLEFKAAEEEEKNGYVKRAFVPGNKSEYLQVLSAADGMDGAGRLKAAKNAIAIDAHNHVSAIARSSYNNGDYSTLKYIRENAHISVSKPIGELLDYNTPSTGSDAQAESIFKLLAFSLGGF